MNSLGFGKLKYRFLSALLPISPIELRVDSDWVNPRPVVVLCEELLIDTVLQTVGDTT